MQEMRERFQRRLGNIMLNPLGIGFGNLGGDTQSNKKVRDKSVSGPHSLRQRLSGIGQKYPAIGATRCQSLALQPRDRLDCGRVGDA